MKGLERQLIHDAKQGEREEDAFYRAWLVRETLGELGPAFPYVLLAILWSPIVLGFVIGWLIN